MAERIKLAPSKAQTTVDLGTDEDSHQFRLRRVTLEVEDQLREVASETAKLWEQDEILPVEKVQAKLAQLDVVLEPNDGKKLKPSEVVLRRYKANEITSGEVDALIDEVSAATRP